MKTGNDDSKEKLNVGREIFICEDISHIKAVEEEMITSSLTLSLVPSCLCHLHPAAQTCW